MVTNGVWMGTGGREDTGRQENESHVGARRDTRGENVYPLATDGQRKFPMWVAKKNLTKRGGQGWLSVGIQTSKATCNSYSVLLMRSRQAGVTTDIKKGTLCTFF